MLLETEMKTFSRACALIALLLNIAEGQAPLKRPDLKLPAFHFPEPTSRFCSHCSRHDPIVAENLPRACSTRLADCDRIEVFLFDENIKGNAAGEGFPIRPESTVLLIKQRKVIKGAESAKLASLWRNLTFDNATKFMNSPDAVSYGFRFYHADRLLFETCARFTTGRFYYPRDVFPVEPGKYSWHGFRFYDAAGNALESYLNALFPGKVNQPKH